MTLVLLKLVLAVLVLVWMYQQRQELWETRHPGLSQPGGVDGKEQPRVSRLARIWWE